MRVTEAIDRAIEQVIAAGVTEFRAGGAMGFDNFAALKIINLKKKYPYIKLHLYLPCRDQTRGWPEREKEYYEYILSCADEIFYASQEYVKGCMHLRNRMMVKGSDYCIAYCNREDGGTAYTVKYAEGKGVKVVKLFDDVETHKKFPERKPTRLRNFDYSSEGAYFVTICTEQRREILSRIVGGDVLDAPNNIELLPCGKIADKYINQMNDYYSNIEINEYVIMPNHIHFILFVSNGGASRTSPPTKQHSTVSQFVASFKRFCNKEYGENIWQREFNDHIIRNRDDYEEHIKYIRENPVRWYYDELYTEG